MPTSRACVGAAYGNSQFELLQPSASFVSDLYMTAEGENGSSASSGSAERWRGFLLRPVRPKVYPLWSVLRISHHPRSLQLCERMPRMWYCLMA